MNRMDQTGLESSLCAVRHAVARGVIGGRLAGRRGGRRALSVWPWVNDARVPRITPSAGADLGGVRDPGVRIESRVHRGCTRTQDAAIRGYWRRTKTGMVTRNRLRNPLPLKNGKEEALGSNPREGLELRDPRGRLDNSYHAVVRCQFGQLV